MLSEKMDGISTDLFSSELIIDKKDNINEKTNIIILPY